MCTFCESEEETIVHLFWDCPIVTILWNEFENLLRKKAEKCKRCKLSECLVIFGSEKNIITDTGFDYLITLVKYFIYKCKFKNTYPTIDGFLSYLKMNYLDEQYISRIYLNNDKFCKKNGCHMNLSYKINLDVLYNYLYQFMLHTACA